MDSEEVTYTESEHPYFADGQWWCDDCDKPATVSMSDGHRYCKKHANV